MAVVADDLPGVIAMVPGRSGVGTGARPLALSLTWKTSWERGPGNVCAQAEG
jgi:hypothetical protein